MFISFNYIQSLNFDQQTFHLKHEAEKSKQKSRSEFVTEITSEKFVPVRDGSISSFEIDTPSP